MQPLCCNAKMVVVSPVCCPCAYGVAPPWVCQIVLHPCGTRVYLPVRARAQCGPNTSSRTLCWHPVLPFFHQQHHIILRATRAPPLDSPEKRVQTSRSPANGTHHDYSILFAPLSSRCVHVFSWSPHQALPVHCTAATLSISALGHFLPSHTQDSHGGFPCGFPAY